LKILYFLGLVYVALSRSFGNRICDEINSDEETISSERGYYTLQSKDKRRNTPLFKSVKRIVKRLRRTNNTNTNSAINRDMNLGKEGHNPQTNEPSQVDSGSKFL
jgi:hypothetical protein